MAVRTFTVKARDKGRMDVSVTVRIVSEPGRLTKGEFESMKVKAADAIMIAVQSFPHLHVGISEIKVTR